MDNETSNNSNYDDRRNKLYEFIQASTAEAANTLIYIFLELLTWCRNHEFGDLIHSGNKNRLDVSELNTTNITINGVPYRTEKEIKEILARYESLRQCVLTIKQYVESGGKTEAEWQHFISDEIVPLLDD